MELRHLRYFIAVAEETTMVAAAKRLRLAQPALTRQIHDLEKELDVELFDRVPRGMVLTPAGEACLDSARHILHQVDAAFETARGSSRGLVGRCVICAGARSLSSGLVARIASFVQATYPGIDLAVSEGTVGRQWDAIRAHDADIGIGIPAGAEYSDLISETVTYDVFDSISVSNAHPLAGRASIALAELQNETFISWNSHLVPEFSRQREAEFKRIGFKPKARRDMDEIYGVIMQVASGQGWTFVPGATTRLIPPNCVGIPLSDFKIPMPHSMIYRSTETRPVVRTILDVIRRMMTAERHGQTLVNEPPVTSVTGPATPAAAIELRHLRYFCAVVEAQSFGRAAERLELTQPALSRQIRDLEHAVGISLLDRAARGATATPGGDSLYRDALRVLDEAAALPAEAQRARRGTTARCIIGAVPSNNALLLLRELFQRGAAEFPKVEVLVYDYMTPEQPGALRAARIDLGLAHASPLSHAEALGIRRERLLNDTMNCALVQAGSELSSRESIELSELADIPLIFPSRAFQPGLYDELFSAFAGLAFHPRIDQSYEGLKTIWALVAEGHGWGLGFTSQCSDPPMGTVAIPINGLSIPWGIDVLLREDESRSIILRVVDVLHEVARAKPA